VELYSYLVVTLLLVSSVHHHCQSVLSAGTLSERLLEFSFLKNRKQQCNLAFIGHLIPTSKQSAVSV